MGVRHDLGHPGDATGTIAAVDVRAEIVAERRDLARSLRELDAADWSAPSWCGGWAVRDVVAHLVTPYVEPPWRTVVEMARRRGVAAAMSAVAARVASRPDDELLRAFEEHLDEVFVPPGAGVRAPLTDVLVHAADITWSLGGERHPPIARSLVALGFVTSLRAAPVFLPFGRLRGLQLVATDTDWSAGRGAVVAGTCFELLLAALGRRAVLDRLDGAGAATLAARCG
jgi:uncharacterized protein (TIGR03083 family)